MYLFCLAGSASATFGSSTQQFINTIVGGTIAFSTGLKLPYRIPPPTTETNAVL
jgi:hypothetical protein